jgi:hypothetical protein
MACPPSAIGVVFQLVRFIDVLASISSMHQRLQADTNKGLDRRPT